MNQELSNMVKLLQKLQQARAIIKDMKVKKEGRNKYSEYDYFTPEQINSMVWKAEKETGLLHTFELSRDPDGVNGHLHIFDIETGEYHSFSQATEIPAIKATNAAQQIGGAVTYTQRYMLMTAFDIADNSLDFDDKDNREQPKEQPKPKEKQVMPDDRFAKMIDLIKKDRTKGAEYITAARDKFVLTETQEMTLIEWEAAL